MLRKKLLRLGHPVSLQALLEDLVADAIRRGGDYRPHVDSLTCMVADGRKLPPWVDIGAGKFGLILSDEPCPELPMGTLLLWLQFRPVPRRGHVAGDLYSGHIVVHLWQSPTYPLSKREVNWLIADRCGAYNDRWRILTRGWETLSYDSSSRSEADADKIAPPYIVLGKTPTPAPSAAPNDTEPKQAPDFAPPSVVRRRKARPGLGTGQARTPWNKALMARMSAVPTEELYDFDRFFQAWADDYLREAGHLPKYPEDDFKQAAASCAERIIRIRAAHNS